MKLRLFLSLAVWASFARSNAPERVELTLEITPQEASLDLSASEFLFALDSFCNRRSLSPEANRIKDVTLRRDHAEFMSVPNELSFFELSGLDESSFALRGFSKPQFDLESMQEELMHLVHSRDTTEAPNAVGLTVSCLRLSPAIMLGEVTCSGEGYSVIWRKTSRGWEYAHSTLNWISCR